MFEALVFVVGMELAPRIWSNAPDRVALVSDMTRTKKEAQHGRKRYVFRVHDADALDLGFKETTHGLAFDANVVTENGACINVADGERIRGERLLVEWPVANVSSVEIVVHAHARKLHVADYWVAKRGR